MSIQRRNYYSNLSPHSKINQHISRIIMVLPNNPRLQLATKRLLTLSHDTSYLSTLLNDRGYAPTSHPLLSLEATAIVKDRMDKLFRGEFETGIYPDEWHWREGISKPNAAREICNSWKSDRSIAAIVLSEKIGAFISRVMGWESVRIAQDDLVWKVPSVQQQPHTDVRRIDTVGFHQDSAYISNQFEPYDNNSVTLWIALDDVENDSGCLEYAVGSHKWKPLQHRMNGEEEVPSSAIDKEISDFHSSDESSYRQGLSLAARLAGVSGNQIEIEKMPVKEGYAILHHQDIYHGSAPNRRSRHRRALVAHYIRGDVEFRQDRGATYIYGRYKRYNSVALDDTFFPIIYGNKRTEWLDDYITTRR